jgi:hypothetical protein
MYLIGSTYTHGADHKSGTKLHKVVSTLEKGKDWIIDHLKYDKKLCTWVKRDNRMRLYYIEAATCWIIAQIPLQYVVACRAGTLEECQEYVRGNALRNRGVVTFRMESNVCITLLDDDIDHDYTIRPLLLASEF